MSKEQSAKSEAPTETGDNPAMWAILELFGHKRLAGLVREVTIAGGSFLRVDVPDENGRTEYTRYYNPAAIYSISPTDQPIAVALAQKVKEPPITRYDLTRFTKSLPVGVLDYEEEDNEGEDFQ
jgi:hypothetical protein